MIKKIAALALIATTILSCNTIIKTTNVMDGNDATTSVIDGSWELSILEGAMIDQSEIQGKKVYFILNSADQTVSGYSGCNVFNGKYTLAEGNRIKFSQIASTRMACPDALLNEQEVLNVFNLADNYTLTDGQLSLNVGRRSPLAIFKKTTVSDVTITEKYWKLKTLEGKEVKMGKSQEKEVYFILKTDENRVVGFSGCNTMGGTYILEEGNRIRFSNMLTTLKACPYVDFDEAAYLKVFDLADNYSIQDYILSLNVGRRAPLAVFEAVYFE